VRVPVGRFDMASRALDFGATAVIAPMVNTVADARAFAASMKYPPLGERSWGPTRLLALRGGMEPQAYLRTANAETLAIAMIETRAALAAVDEILATDGIDGIFVGPSDFSLALSDGARVDALNEEMLTAAGEVAGRAEAAGKFAGIFTFTVEMARRARDLGFRFINVSGDIGILTAGAASIVRTVTQ
jgi:4-hydroxy-2-oxoheptanedioate aldolase